MAKVLDGTVTAGLQIIESPDPNSNVIYIEQKGYKKDTLAPLFNASMNVTTTDYKDWRTFDNQYYNNTDTAYHRTGAEGASMALTKDCAFTTQGIIAGNSTWSTNVSDFGRLSLDPTMSNSPIKKFVNGSDSVIIYNASYAPYNGYRHLYWKNTSSEFHTQQPTTHAGGSFNSGPAYFTNPRAHMAQNGDWLSMIGNVSNLNNPAYGSVGRVGLYRDSIANNASYGSLLTQRDGYNLRYIGSSQLTGDPIYLYNYASTNDYNQYITRHNLTSNTTTDLNTFTSAPPARDSFSTWTNDGGARGTTNISYAAKSSSVTFDDPTSLGNKCWYTPYFDVNYNYHPHFFQWDVSTDTFVRNTDITIVGDLSSTHLTSILNNGINWSNYFDVDIWNETFVSNNTRYLTVMTMTGQYARWDATPAARTWITYSVNALNPKELTHHSTITIPTTPRQVIFLNDSKTTMGVFTYGAFHIYKWNDSTGWDLASTINERFSSVGRDSLGRIWALDANVDSKVSDIHLITTDTPVQITVVPENTSYDYTGTTIATYVNVSAYDYTGARMAIGITLEIAGTSMQFSAGASTVNVTTSATAETQVALNIVDGGFSEITAYTTV